MGDFLLHFYSGASWFYSLHWLPHVNLSTSAVPVSLLFAAVGAYLLGHYTRSLGHFGFPLNFAMLFVGGLGGNWLLAATGLRFQEEFQGPMIFALFGMTLAAISVMVVVKGE